MGDITKYDFFSVGSNKLVPLNLTDANAEAFAILHGERFRYDYSRGKWMVWNGRYWAADENGRAALDTARQKLSSERTKAHG